MSETPPDPPEWDADRIENYVTELEQQVSSLTKSLETEKANHAVSSKWVDQLEKKADELDDQVSALQAENKILKSAFGQMGDVKMVRGLKEKISSLEAENQELAKDRNWWLRQHKQLAGEKEQLKAENKELIEALKLVYLADDEGSSQFIEVQNKVSDCLFNNMGWTGESNNFATWQAQQQEPTG